LPSPAEGGAGLFGPPKSAGFWREMNPVRKGFSNGVKRIFIVSGE